MDGVGNCLVVRLWLVNFATCFGGGHGGGGYDLGLFFWHRGEWVRLLAGASIARIGVSIAGIFLGRPRGFGPPVDALRFEGKVGWIGWSMSSLALCFDSPMYVSLTVRICPVFGAQVLKCLMVCQLYLMKISYQFFWISDLCRFSLRGFNAGNASKEIQMQDLLKVPLETRPQVWIET